MGTLSNSDMEKAKKDFIDAFSNLCEDYDVKVNGNITFEITKYDDGSNWRGWTETFKLKEED